MRFFIGIVGFSSANGCLKMGLNGDYSKVSSTSTVISVSYSSVHIYYKSLALMKLILYPFVNKIQYVFENLTDIVTTSAATFNHPSIVFNSYNGEVLEVDVVQPIGSSMVWGTMYIFIFNEYKKTIF